jgi:hypothetical protein
MALRASRRARMSRVTGPSRSIAKLIAAACRTDCGIEGFRISQLPTRARFANCDFRATPKRLGAVAPPPRSPVPLALRASRRARMSRVTEPSRSIVKLIAAACRADCGIGGFRISQLLTRARFANCDFRATPKRLGAVAHQAMRRDDAQRLVLFRVGEALVAVEPAQQVERGLPFECADERRARLRDATQLDNALGRPAGEGARRRRLPHKRSLERHDRGAPARVEADRNRQPMPAGVAGRAGMDARRPRTGSARGAFG